MVQNSNIYRHSLPDTPLRQGEILSNLIQVVIDLESIGNEEIVIDDKAHPYAIVVSQDCDLDWDYKARQGHGDAKEHKLVPRFPIPYKVPCMNRLEG